jgi:hypothetical protein
MWSRRFYILIADLKYGVQFLHVSEFIWSLYKYYINKIIVPIFSVFIIITLIEIDELITINA